jgi:glycosidase
MTRRLCTIAAALLVLLCPVSLPAAAQSTAVDNGKPVLTKIDPPDWWVNMPAPMLLLHGEHLRGANFRLSSGVRIARTTISENGHWAELWLADEPKKPIQIEITATNAAGETSVPFRFAARRPASEGFAGFSSRDVVYLIMTDRFADGDLSNDGPEAKSAATSATAIAERSRPHGWHGGDYKGLLDHLDYLQTLGITTIWITPPYQNHEPDSYHGYGATDMYAVDEHFGSMQDLQALAAGLHRRRMKLVLDTVPNHVGPAHPWVQDEPQPDWFHGTVAHHRAATGVFQQLMNPSAPERDRLDVLDGWFVDLLPDMDQEDKAVSNYLIQNAIWWIESTAADGLRLDTFPYVPRQFWHDFHAELASLFPRLTDVGEVFNGTFALPPAVNAFFTGGVTRIGRTTAIDTGLYTPFDYPFYAVIRDVLLHDAPISNLALLFSQDTLYPHPERLATLIGSHDTKRFLGEEHASAAKLRLAVGLLLTIRGMPIIYSGDEIGMTGGEDPDNRRDFPGGFPGVTTDAFTASGRTAIQQEMFEWTSQLLALRAKHPVLKTGQLQTVFADDSAIAYLRTTSTQGCTGATGDERYLVVVNNADKPRDLPIETEATGLASCTQWNPAMNATASPHKEGSKLHVALDAKQLAIYRVTGGGQTNAERTAKSR